MKDNLVISKMHVIGFASIPEMKYNWSRSGLNTIVGENGVGKSSILNALSWCIYGSLIKKGSSIEPWSDTKSDDYEGSMVKVEINRWDNKYKIIRCKDYKGEVEGNTGNNRLVLVVNNKVSNLRDKADVQQEINRIMGRSFDLFKSSTLFGQGLQKIIEQDGPMKKKVFEEAFGVTFISEAKKKVELKIPNLKSQVIRSEDLLNSTKESLVMIRETLKLAKSQDKSERVKWKERLLGAKKELADYKLYYDKLKVPDKINRVEARISRYRSIKEKRIEKVDELRKEEWDFNRKVNTAGSEVEQQEIEYQDLKNRFVEVGKVCPECGQKLSKEKIAGVKKKVKEAISELKASMSELKESYNKLEGTYARIKNRLEKSEEKLKTQCLISTNKIVKLESEKDALYEQRAMSKGRIQTLNDNIIKIEANKPKLVAKTTEKLKEALIEKKELLSKQKYALGEAIEELELNEWLLKDPLSNSGLKSYLFNAKMGKINKRLRKYEDYIGFRVEASIDLLKHNKDLVINIFQGKHKRPYEDLSGGQRQLTNLVLAFAIYAISNEGSNINVLITDEAFESLSTKNLEILSNILQDLAREKSVHVITHQRAFNPTNSYQRVLELNDKLQTVISSKLAQN